MFFTPVIYNSYVSPKKQIKKQVKKQKVYYVYYVKYNESNKITNIYLQSLYQYDLDLHFYNIYFV